MFAYMEQLFDFFGLVIDTESMTIAEFLVYFVKVLLSVYILREFMDIIVSLTKISSRGVI